MALKPAWAEQEKVMEKIIIWATILAVMLSFVGGCCPWRYEGCRSGENDTYLRYYDLMPKNEVQFNN
jgi:hypothetical protein